MPKKTKQKILSIETLHIQTDEGPKIKRFARTLIDEKGKETREIIDTEGKWREISEGAFYAEVEDRRTELIEELTSEEPIEESEEESKN